MNEFLKAIAVMAVFLFISIGFATFTLTSTYKDDERIDDKKT